MRPRLSVVLVTLAVLAAAAALAVPTAQASPSSSGADSLALLAAQQGELTVADAAVYDYLGCSVALDGDTALVGADGRSYGRGAAYVFTRSGSTWTQQAELIATGATAGYHIGCSVALDGDTALIGAYGPNSNQGAAYVFTRSGATWTQQGDAITATGGASGDRFGCAVAVDGDTALVGAYARSSYQGAAYVFTRSGTTWTQQGEALTATGGAAGYLFGCSVAIDGESALVGASGNSAAYVFTCSGSTWTQQAVLAASGYSVALDGDTALIGQSSGTAAYVFTRSGSTWTQQAKLTVSADAVALDGDTALLGASFWNAAYVFTRSGSTWTQQDTLTGTGSFGDAVALDGDTTLVGAPDQYSEQGAAYVFAPPTPSITTVTPTSAKRGASVTISGSDFGATQGTSSVSFGSTACTGYASWSDTSITCTVPAAAALGAQDVTVTAASGTSGAKSFTVLPYDEPTVMVSGAGSGWHGSAVELTVTATVDPLLTLTSLEYSTDGGSTWSEVPGTGTTRALTISAEGETTVQVRATDSEGQTASDSATVRIDAGTPTITASGSDDAWHASPVTLTFTPVAGPSGVASVEYRLGDGAWTTLAKTAGAYELTVSRNGETAVGYRTTSGAGLTSDVGSCTVKIDIAKPKVKVKKAAFKRGATATLKLYVAKTPAGCGKAKVTVKIYKGKKLKKSFATAYLAVNKWQTVRSAKLKKLARGKYVMKLQAVDKLSNRQSGWTTATLTVK